MTRAYPKLDKAFNIKQRLRNAQVACAFAQNDAQVLSTVNDCQMAYVAPRDTAGLHSGANVLLHLRPHPGSQVLPWGDYLGTQ